MKKKTGSIILHMIAIFIILSFAINMGVNYINRPTMISQSISTDGVYTLDFVETQSPTFFSQSDVCIVLKRGNEEKQEFYTEIANDGKRLDQNNWEVIWNEDRVTVTLKGEEQDDQVIVMRFMTNKYR
nr:hypothetical protein [uncultured Peptostreptococcus sp.]